MKIHNRISAVLGILIVLASLGFAGFSGDALDYSDKELDLFFKGKEYLFKRDWDTAVELLDKYLKDYPSGQFRDEALYWLAQCLNSLSRSEDDANSVIELKVNAIEKLDRLVDLFPKSLWRDDGQELRVEIAGELVMMGKPEYEKYINEAISQQNKSASDVKLMALNSLIKLEPETALPVLKRILQTDPDPKIRKNAALLLGRNYSQSVVDVLESVSRKDDDKGVRDESAYWLEQIRIRLIPVELNYYAYSAYVVDPSVNRRLPLKKLNRFSLKHSNPGGNAAKGHISRFFNGDVGRFSSVATSRGVANVYTTMEQNNIYSRISHKLHNVRLQLLGQTLQKRSDKITGQVLFQDLDDGQKYYGSFSVNQKEDNLFVMRKGDKAVVMLLQFERQAAEQVEEESSRTQKKARTSPFIILEKIFRVKEKPVYYTVYSNYMGCEVHTTMKSSGAGSLKEVMDFSLAKAVIPSSEGRWTLTGYLLAIKKDRMFRARKASLFDPEGKVVAVADEITVPVDSPDSFTIKGDRMDEVSVKDLVEERKPEEQAPVGSTIRLKNGVEIRSNEQTIDLSETVVDFKASIAKIPGKGGTWILAGFIRLEWEKNQLRGTTAVLKDPSGKVVALNKEIIVPLDKPENYKILDEGQADSRS